MKYSRWIKTTKPWISVGQLYHCPKCRQVTETLIGETEEGVISNHGERCPKCGWTTIKKEQ